MWKDWLSFTRREQHGILLLALLLLFFILLRLTLPFWLYPDTSVLYENLNAARQSIHQNPKPTRESPATSSPAIEVFPFNPNEVTAGELSKMGLPARVIVNWLKFLEAGGSFSSPGDIKKIYGLDSLVAEKLVAAAHVKPTSPSSSRTGADALISKKYHDKNYSAGKRSGSDEVNEAAGLQKNRQAGLMPYRNRNPETEEMVMVLDINKADAEELMKLKGIGPVLSKRIVDFRKSLGGYWSVEQIKEVYGISDELYVQLYENLKVDTSLIEYLAVNHSSVRWLRKHPYINFYQARDIVEFRKNSGPLSGPADLETLASFNKESLQRLLPYLKFDTDSLFISEKNRQEKEKKQN